MANKDSLALRKEMRKTKPAFVVRESHFSGRIESRWRYPYGRHSKVRQMHCGRPAMPNPGYGAPVEVRGLHPSGLAMIVVHNADELLAIEPETQGAIIAAGVGDKKKVSLLEVAQKKNIAVLNVKDAAKAVESINKCFQERKELRKKKLSEAGKKEEEKKKKAEERSKKEAENKKHQHEHNQDHGQDHGQNHAEENNKEEQQQKIAEKTITKRQ